MPVGGIKRPEPRRHHRVIRDITPMCHRLAIEAPEPRAAIRSVTGGMTRPKLPVEPNSAKLLSIFPDQRALARDKIEVVEVVPARIAIVETDGDLVRCKARPAIRERANVGQRREVAQF